MVGVEPSVAIGAQPPTLSTDSVILCRPAGLFATLRLADVSGGFLVGMGRCCAGVRDEAVVVYQVDLSQW